RWFFDLARRVVRGWGYGYLRVDRLRWATLGTAHDGGLTHAEAYRAGLGAIRDGLGTEAFLLASEAPLQHAVGLVNGMRIGPDVDVSWSGIQSPARAAGLRSFYHRSTWLNDPDCLVVRAPLSRAAAEVWASVVAVTGGLTLLGVNLPNLPPDRLPLLQRTLPVPPVTGRPIGAGAAGRDTAPADVAGEAVYPLGGEGRVVRGGPQTYRRYPLPPEGLSWGGENVLAVRVLGSGGIWSVRRNRPPRVWVAEGAPRWWTVVVVNWEDDPRDASLPLGAVGIK